MSYIPKVNLYHVQGRLGSIARDVITLEKVLSKQHPEFYACVRDDLDLIIQRIYTIRNEMRRYDYTLTYKNIF